MLPIVDIPTIQYIIQEAVDNGIEEILIITNSNNMLWKTILIKTMNLKKD